MTSMEAYLVKADQVMDTGKVLPVVDGVPLLPGWEVLEGTAYRMPIVQGEGRCYGRCYGWLVRHCRSDRPPEAIAPSVWRRELRLWACDCAERVQSDGADPRSLEAIAVARRYAVGDATVTALGAAAWAAWSAELAVTTAWSTWSAELTAAAEGVAASAAWSASLEEESAWWSAQLAAESAEPGEPRIQAIMLAKRLNMLSLPRVVL